MTKEESHLHKVYRAVFDNVCPSCGGVMKVMPLGTRQCGCGFNVTELEMQGMRPAVKAVLREAVETFESWRSVRP